MRLELNTAGSPLKSGDSCVRSLAIVRNLEYGVARKMLAEAGRKCAFCEWEGDFDIWLMANGFEQIKLRTETFVHHFPGELGRSGKWIVSAGRYYWAVINGTMYDNKLSIDPTRRVYAAYRDKEQPE